MSDWTIDTLKELTDQLRQSDATLAEERDRRYAEVAAEREKALKIKETADLAALELAREIQTYKDEKANNLRTQIEGERGNYATKDDLSTGIREVMAVIKPLTEYVSGQQGGGQAVNTARLNIGTIATVIAALVVVITFILTR